jgi:multiple sugar transport system permease protein
MIQNRISEIKTGFQNTKMDRYVVSTYFVYFFGIFFFLFPTIWVISMSIRPEGAILTYPPQIIPTEISTAPYEHVLFESQMLTWVWNSIKVTTFQVIGILFVTIPAAYAFSRFSFRGKKFTLVGILLFQMISPVVIVIPMYSMMNTMGLLDSHFGLTLLYVGLQIPFSIWLLKSYFDTIPVELEESAHIDGCNRLQALWHVLLPSVLPGIVVVVIFNFVFSWAEFVMAFTLLNDSSLYTVSIGVYAFDGQYGTSWTLISAAAVVAMIPILIMFFALQRYFIRGLAEGAVKG